MSSSHNVAINNTLDQGQKPLVLIVDDDPAIRLLCSETLQAAGFRTSESVDAESVQTIIQDIKPDLILLDVILPGMDGFELCASLRQQEATRYLPILIMTGLEDVESIDRAFDTGATDFITKPINWAVLSHRVKYIYRSWQSMQELRVSELRLAEAQRLAHLGNWDWDILNNKLFWSEEIFNILGLDPNNTRVDFERFMESIHQDDREYILQAVDYAIKNHQPYVTEHRMVRPNGNVRIVIETGKVWYQGDQPVRMQGTMQDVTERKLTEEKIKNLAYFDTLTELPNRVLFREHTQLEMELAKRRNQQLVILHIGLDRFKRINDTLGHMAGDKVLQTMAERISNCVRGSDIMASFSEPRTKDDLISRLGGDEFIVLLNQIDDINQVRAVIQRLREKIAEPITLAKEEIFLTACFGIVNYPSDGENVEILLKNADTALSYAKKEGANNFKWYSSQMHDRAMEFLSMEAGLNKAIELDELVLYYQPQIDVESGRVIGLEALLRWGEPTRGMIPPLEFIPLAEETGLIVPIGEWVIKTACNQSIDWQDQGLDPMRIAINLSARQFKQSNLLANIEVIFQHTGVDPKYLEFELTESIIMENAHESITILNKLKDLGCSLAVDDFGTGYSSLSYLKRFPLDFLKIDRSLIKDITTNDGDAAIARAIISLSKSLNLKVVAEGVETESQLEFLKQQGCDYIQGFYFSRPIPADQVPEFIQSRL